MLIIGLTGSIGMGKSTAAKRFQALGVPVIDADALVHGLYAGAAVAPIEAVFPGVTTDGRVDRQKLGAMLLADPAGFKRLEAIVHPLVFKAEQAANQVRRYHERFHWPLGLAIVLLLAEFFWPERKHGVASSGQGGSAGIISRHRLGLLDAW